MKMLTYNQNTKYVYKNEKPFKLKGKSCKGKTLNTHVEFICG